MLLAAPQNGTPAPPRGCRVAVFGIPLACALRCWAFGYFGRRAGALEEMRPQKWATHSESGALRKKLRKYPGLNTPLGIPGVFFGVFPFLVYSCPFLGYSGPEYPKLLRLGYFAWCIPKVTAPTPGTFALK